MMLLKIKLLEIPINYLKEFNNMKQEEKMQIVLIICLFMILFLSIISNIYIRSKIKQVKKDFKDKYN